MEEDLSPGWLCRIEWPTCSGLPMYLLIWSKRERNWCLVLASAVLVSFVAAYSIYKLIKKFNAWCFFPFLVGIQMFPQSPGRMWGFCPCSLRKGNWFFSWVLGLIGKYMWRNERRGFEGKKCLWRKKDFISTKKDMGGREGEGRKLGVAPWAETEPEKLVSKERIWVHMWEQSWQKSSTSSIVQTLCGNGVMAFEMSPGTVLAEISLGIWWGLPFICIRNSKSYPVTASEQSDIHPCPKTLLSPTDHPEQLFHASSTLTYRRPQEKGSGSGCSPNIRNYEQSCQT